MPDRRIYADPPEGMVQAGNWCHYHDCPWQTWPCGRGPLDCDVAPLFRLTDDEFKARVNGSGSQ